MIVRVRRAVPPKGPKPQISLKQIYGFAPIRSPRYIDCPRIYDNELCPKMPTYQFGTRIKTVGAMEVVLLIFRP